MSAEGTGAAATDTSQARLHPGHIALQPTDPPAAPALRLARLNAAGFCRECLVRGCADPQCVTRWSGFVWTECHTCHGSGSADYALAVANGGPDLACTPCGRCADGVQQD